MSAALESLRKAHEARVLTDRRVSVAWLLLPIANLLVVLAFIIILFAVIFSGFYSSIRPVGPGTTPPVTTPPNFAGALAGFSIVAVILFAIELLNLYFVYILIRRRNQHFSRQQHFVADLSMVLRQAAMRKSVNADAYLLSIDNYNRQAQAEESEKSAVLWTVLLIVPLVSVIAEIYIYYFLTTDYYKHERKEDGMLSDVERTLSLLGVQFIFHRNEPLPHRSFVVYFIVTILTLGIFSFYWQYTFIKDPNVHFVNHAVYEGMILQQLGPIS